MSRTISQVSTSDTFQVWLQRTNDVVSELGTSVMTASALGDTTTGNATLFGSFTSNTVVVGTILRTGVIDALVGNSSPLDIRNQTEFTSSSQIPVILENPVGPRIRIKNNNISWLAGLRGSAGAGTDAQFVIGVEGSDFAFRIGTDGTIYANNIILDSDSSSPTGVVRANRTINTNNGITGGGNLTADRTFGLTGQALALHNLATNGIVSRTGSGTVAARTVTAGSGITITNGNGVSGNPTVAIDSSIVMTLAGTQTITGAKTFSSAASFSSTLGVSGTTNLNSTVNVTGVTNFSADVNFGHGDTLTFNTDNLQMYGDGANARVKASSSMYIDMIASGSVVIRNSANAVRFTMDTSTGNFTATGNITASSDARLKSNVQTVESALSKVLSMRGVYYDKDGKRGVGVIAQEMEQILPEVVEDGEHYKSVAYGNIVGVLIEAIKELSHEVEILRSQR